MHQGRKRYAETLTPEPELTEAFLRWFLIRLCDWLKQTGAAHPLAERPSMRIRAVRNSCSGAPWGPPFGSVGCIVQAWISKSSAAVFARDIFLWRIDAAGFVYISLNVIRDQWFYGFYNRTFLQCITEGLVAILNALCHGRREDAWAMQCSKGLNFCCWNRLLCLSENNLEYYISNDEILFPKDINSHSLLILYHLIWDVYAKNKSNTNQ